MSFKRCGGGRCGQTEMRVKGGEGRCPGSPDPGESDRQNVLCGRAGRD